MAARDAVAAGTALAAERAGAAVRFAGVAEAAEVLDAGLVAVLAVDVDVLRADVALAMS
ncbi:hypothetical protein [Shimia ponticola]|uniref:hypothetical protein n=1 Tax=Shimia ponticola TaxID=2582893 RepID=UPI00164C930C|nr:hypothetical protein [Shimia ponticola]